jgi:ubiquinone/menaquinone biosynthesis C-methylase UbiE
MKPDYKNWMPRGMIWGTLALSAVSFALSAAAGRQGSAWSKGAAGALLLCGGAALGAAAWMNKLYWAFSYDGNRQMSRQIIDGTAEYIHLPEGGIGLDVGCGSGALTIACAKRNPQARMIGMDRWGKEYASFSKKLCESNAEAEGVENVSFQNGDAVKLAFPDESFDAVTSNYVYHNIPSRDRKILLRETLRVLKKGGCFAIHDIMSATKYGDMEEFVQALRQEGFERVELIDTTNGKFMSPGEAKWMGLSGSALLVGIK